MAKYYFILIILLTLVSCEDKASDIPEYIKPAYFDSDVDWHPDGSHFVFIRLSFPMENKFWGYLYYNTLDSSISFLLQDPYSFKNSPRFSPDGAWIVFSSNNNIFKMKANGDSLTQLTFTYWNSEPDWSPNGELIAYFNNGGDDRGIYLLDIATLEYRLIHRYSARPVWFPDGERLLAATYIYGSPSELIIIDTAGNVLTRLQEDGHGISYHSDVSPDGNLICFGMFYPGKQPQLWLVNADGSDLHQLTTESGDMPAFSPDGEWIVYTHTANRDGSLFAIRPDGTDNHRLTDFNSEE